MASILFILAVIPVLVICTYIYRKDKNKEPGPLLIKLFLLGIASSILVLLISAILFKIFPFMEKDTSYMSFLEVLIFSFVGVALIEEFCKWLMCYKTAYHDKAYDELYDGIVYAVFVSLGFAFLENILYVFGSENVISGVVTGINRGLLSVPGHACNAVFMGYYLSLAKVYASKNRKDLEKKSLIKSILIPTLFHGIYDFCLFATNVIPIITFFIFVIILYIISIKKIKELAGYKTTPNSNKQQTPPQQQYNNQLYEDNTTTIKNNFCPACGLKVNSSFCPQCGTRQN